ncbi:MAG: hypothetical protein HYT71_03040 [Candidatus Aenigmarchaeota archaeon]|nr:hypothetical protein [Candidatus Aenigmarchaeota archaeon]
MAKIATLYEVTGMKDFQVMASGHGSRFRFDGLDPDKPTLPNKTLVEAYLEGDRWVGIADTIGGQAQIYKASTGEIIGLENAADMIKRSIGADWSKKYDQGRRI